MISASGEGLEWRRRDLARAKFRKRWIAFMDDIVAARMNGPTSDHPRDLFDVLVAARDPETGVAFSRPQLRDQMSTMIVAGHETTALALFCGVGSRGAGPRGTRGESGRPFRRSSCYGIA
jgi:cytochrome P450